MPMYAAMLFMLIVAALSARRLRSVIATRHTSPRLERHDLRQAGGGLVLAPGLGLLCQVAMSGTMIYMLVPMV